MRPSLLTSTAHHPNFEPAAALPTATASVTGGSRWYDQFASVAATGSYVVDAIPDHAYVWMTDDGMMRLFDNVISRLSAGLSPTPGLATMFALTPTPTPPVPTENRLSYTEHRQKLIEQELGKGAVVRGLDGAIVIEGDVVGYVRLGL